MSTLAPQAPGRVLSTMESDGSRRWLTPKLARGKLLRRRRAVAYALIALLTALPLIPINGLPAVLLDVPNRRFTLLGYTFLPTDTVLLALLALAWFGSIFLTTAVAGRAWCGWTCPQTVYMEFVYRPIERLCLGRSGVGGRPRAGLSPLRKMVMHILFVLISLAITHTLLSYFVGASQLRHWMASSPADHPWAFGVIAFSSLAVWYNFVFFREQMCIVACPYGRFQSVLLDRHSTAVRYDVARGEPRTKIQSTKRTVALPAMAEQRVGDCVDCQMCVQVCPTGIDIRDGLQLECVNCTQCIDACNAVMEKVGRPEGLIGFYSQANIEGESTRFVRPRVILYGIITVGFTAALLVLVLTKKPFDASLTRNFGMPFFITPSGQVQNTMRLTIRNRSDHDQTFVISSKTEGIAIIGDVRVVVPAQQSLMAPVELLANPSKVAGGVPRAEVVVTNQQSVERDLSYEFFAPGVQP